MLPSLLSSTYKQYKEDTYKIATWLATTAKSLGYVSYLLTAGPPPEKKPKTKAKPKTKKQLRDAARRVPREQREFIIPVKEFMTLGNYIANHLKEPLKVPQTLLNTIKQAIDARRMSNDWFRTHEKDEKSDEGHAHFVGILEKVHNVLKPHGEPSEPSESDSEITLVDTDFASLTLEKLPEQSRTPGSSQPLSAQHHVEYQAEPMEDASRMLFAAFAMFHDINKIFGYISNLWESYRRHEVELVTVAIAANTATDFVRRLEGEFFSEFKEVKNVEQLINCLYMLKCDADGVRPEARPSQRDLARFNLDRYDLVRWLFLDTLSLLSAFADAAGSNQILVYRPGTYGTYKPKVNRENLSNAEKFREDKIVLLEALPDFTVLARFTKSILAEDELTRGIRLLLEKKELHLWTLFAAQSFLEAHHVLREDIGTSFDQLQTLGKKAKDGIARVRHFQTSKIFSSKTGQQKMTKQFKRVFSM